MLMTCGVSANSVHCTPRSLRSHGSSSRGVHMPEKSGLPFAVLGAGAVRLGEPSALRGMPLVGTWSHCAARGAEMRSASHWIRMARILWKPNGVDKLRGESLKSDSE